MPCSSSAGPCWRTGSGRHAAQRPPQGCCSEPSGVCQACMTAGAAHRVQLHGCCCLCWWVLFLAGPRRPPPSSRRMWYLVVIEGKREISRHSSPRVGIHRRLADRSWSHACTWRPWRYPQHARCKVRLVSWCRRRSSRSAGGSSCMSRIVCLSVPKLGRSSVWAQRSIRRHCCCRRVRMGSGPRGRCSSHWVRPEANWL